jgi:uracil-DNA glycosylase family 4
MTFPAGTDIDQIRTIALGCTRCRLAEGRTQVVWADGNLESDLLFIGEAPGFHEDKEGKPFVGAAGQLLDKLLAEIGLDRSRTAIVNVIKCRPPGNRDPLPDELETCKPYLDAQLAHMRPTVIVTLGNFATRYILEEQIGITRARGRRYERRGAVVIPTFHPAAALRGGRFGGMSPIDGIREDLQLVRRVLDERTRTDEPAPAAITSASAEAGDASSSEQLGLF